MEKLKGILGRHGATYKSFEVGSKGLRGRLSCRVSLHHVFNRMGGGDSTDREQAQCYEGTVFACRAIDMAKAVAERRQVHKILPVSTLENPPPSDCLQHISAWELPEMDKFIQQFQVLRPFQHLQV